MTAVPDIAVINFSSLPDTEVQDAIRAVNRQVLEDFQPIWGSAYLSRLHASAYDPAHPDTLQEDPVQAEGVVYLVDQPHIQGALGYHDRNASEVPVGFVFTDLGDWTVTLSHEVLELIVDPTVNIYVPGPDPREPGNPNAWLLHSYEVCDAVERTDYEIDGVRVSNFVTPQYFAEGDAKGTRNDFLGVGVDSFGVISGSHLGVVDPTTWDWVTILGSEHPSRAQNARRMKQFARRGVRPRPDEKVECALEEYRSAKKHLAGCSGLPDLTAFTRGRRKQLYAESRRGSFGKPVAPKR